MPFRYFFLGVSFDARRLLPARYYCRSWNRESQILVEVNIEATLEPRMHQSCWTFCPEYDRRAPYLSDLLFSVWGSKGVINMATVGVARDFLLYLDWLD